MDLKSHSPRLALAAAALALFAACSVEQPPEASTEASPAPASAPAGIEQPGRQLPDLAPRDGITVQEQTATDVAADAVRVGSAVDAQGMASEAKAIYGLDDTVHASVSTRGISPAAALSVYWTFEDGRTHKEESTAVPAGDHASFSFSRADGMQPGLYNVQVDADFQPIGIAEFRVQ